MSRIRFLLQYLKSWDTVAVLLLVGWPLTFFWQVTLGQRVFGGDDIVRMFFPFRLELTRALAEGRLPLWTSGMQAGFPLFAEGQMTALYPFDLGLHWLMPAHTALALSILFHFAWASLGMYLFVRVSGYRESSALLAGLVFGFGGFALAHLSHPTLFAATAWLPWLVCFQKRCWRDCFAGRKTFVFWFLMMSLSIGLQLLGGHPQLVFLNLIAFTLLGVLETVSQPIELTHGNRWLKIGMRRLPLTILLIIASTALGAGIAAVQLFPTAELVGFSMRSVKLTEYSFQSYSLDPTALARFFVPFWHIGIPTLGNLESWGYIGILPILLVLLAPWLSHDPRVWFFLGLGLLSLVLALGEFTPVYGWLYHIPVLNQLRAPARFLHLFVFAGAFLAASSFEKLQARLHAWGQRTGLLAGGVVVAIGFAINLSYSQPLDVWMTWWVCLPIGLFIASAGLISAAWTRRISQATFTVLGVGLVVLDLVAFAAPFLAGPDKMVFASELTQVPRSVQAMDSRQVPYRVMMNRTYYAAGVSSATDRAILKPNLAVIYQKQSADVYTPLALRRNEEYAEQISPRTLDLMNIRYYLLPAETSVYLPNFLNAAEPKFGLTLDILSQPNTFAPTHVTGAEITSYTDKTENLPDGFAVGELQLLQENDTWVTCPIRLGNETADWAFDGLAKIGEIKHTKPANAIAFPAYLSSVGRDFQGYKYIARCEVAPATAPLVVKAVRADSFLPDGGLTIEQVSLIDERNNRVSLAALLQRSEFSLAFRSHTVAMWENQSVLPRAFMAYEAQVVQDEQMLTRLNQPAFRPDQIVLLSDGQPLTQQDQVVVARNRESVTIAEYKSERVVVKTQTDRTGYLVLTDSRYPGWVAQVDGATAPIRRADYIFRAVLLTPGEHTVTFEYHPLSLVYGAAITVTSLLITLAIALIGWQSWRHPARNIGE
jgi:hypothetical protein